MPIVENVPRIEGLSFRRFNDKADFVVMSELSQRSWLADGFEWMQTAEDIAISFKDTEDRDPFKDVLMIEIGGKAIGFGEVSVEKIDGDKVILWNTVHLLAEWRGRGIREAVFDYDEEELIRRSRKVDARSFFQIWASDAPNDWKSLVLSRGFEPSWHVLEMVRPKLDDIPTFDLPSGLEIRPVAPPDYRLVWEGMKEAYREEPWFTEGKFDESSYRQWISSPDLNSDLWQAAWDGSRLVGIVQNFIRKEENETFGRKRGHTERIFVAPSWQRKGVARALISRSLRVLRDEGMEDATLDVTAENVSGALNLYRTMGYREIHHFTFYRKSLPGRQR